jgi:large subunit ribosomal protein L10
MPKNKVQKGEIFRDLSEKIKKSKSIIFAGFNALGVKDNENLREQLRKENGEYYVAKKTLMNLALKENKIDLNAREFAGKVAALFAYEDEIAPAKILGNFRKDKEKTEKISFLGGILDGKLLSKEEAEALSNLPSKPELYAKIVGSLNAPVSGFVNVLAGNFRKLVYVLKAIETKKTN